MNTLRGSMRVWLCSISVWCMEGFHVQLDPHQITHIVQFHVQ